MKLQFIFVAVAIIIIASACKKDNPAPVTHVKPRHAAYGTVTVNRNGQPWPMRVYGVAFTGSPISGDSAFSLVMSRYIDSDGDSLLRDATNIGNIRYRQYNSDLEYYLPAQNSIYSAANTSEYCFYDQYFDDGDVISLPRSLLLTEPHFIEITSYNPKTKEVSGRFAASFLSYNKLDTFRWTDGVFNTKVFPE